MRDKIHYALPLGLLGALAHRLFVRRTLEHIFTFRQQLLARRFGPPG